MFPLAAHPLYRLPASAMEPCKGLYCACRCYQGGGLRLTLCSALKTPPTNADVSSPCVAAVTVHAEFVHMDAHLKPTSGHWNCPVASSTTMPDAKGASTMTIQSTATGDALSVADTTDPTQTDVTGVELWLLSRSNPCHQHRNSRSFNKHGQYGRGSHLRGRGSAAVEMTIFHTRTFCTLCKPHF